MFIQEITLEETVFTPCTTHHLARSTETSQDSE